MRQGGGVRHYRELVVIAGEVEVRNIKLEAHQT